MKTKYLILGILALLIFIIGCAEKECKIADDCISKTCFTAECEDNNCTYSPIPDCCGNDKCEYGETYESCAGDCLNCDDTDACTVDTYDYHEEECVNAPNLDVVCCGNTVCEVGETYESCSRDCLNCEDDNKCTKDKYDYHEQKCVNEVIIPCCGNEICDEDFETYSICSTDCLNCNDNDKLTTDSFNYETQECENIATHYFTDDFESGTQDWSFTGAEGGTTTGWSTAVEDGNTVLKGTGHNWANLAGREWSNYIFKFRFKRVSGSMHANFRLGSGRYFVNLHQGSSIELRKASATGDIQTLKTTSFSPGSQWHTMEIRGYNNILNVYVDDGVMIKYKDTEDAILSGRAAFETIQGEFLIDDVEIKVIANTDVAYP